MRLTFIFFSLLALIACKKSDDHIESQGDSIEVVQDSFYFKAKLNGADVSWVVPSHKNEPSFTYNAGASVGYSDFSNGCLEGYCYYLSAFTQIFKNVPEVQPQMNIGFNMAASSRSKDEVYSWFSPGTKTYQTSIRNSTQSDLLDPSKNGLVVFYIDQNNKSWSSNRGNQQGSVFKSVSLTDESRGDVSTEKVWKATFSCLLYDDAGNSIKLENGEIYGPVGIR